ncbi:hypothetical protein XENOCAPTIV_007229 [Xenoophorus captivus]|uniref:Uncharacterized protein n=2 Tax=Goodeidae TaxID=28758 RepID=A0ABV0QZ13_9TELE
MAWKLLPLITDVLFAYSGEGVCSERHRAPVTSLSCTFNLQTVKSQSCHSPLISIILPLSLLPLGICLISTMFFSLSLLVPFYFFPQLLLLPSISVSPSVSVRLPSSVSSCHRLLSTPLVNKYEPKSHFMSAAAEHIFTLPVYTKHTVILLYYVVKLWR